MKLKYMLLACMPLWMASCSEKDVISGTPQQQVRVTAGLGNNSRMVLSDQGSYFSCLWENSDQISLFTSTQSNLVYHTTIEENTATAAFTPVDEALEDIDGNTVYACYPDVTLASEEGLVVNLPSTATIAYNDGTLRSFAYATSTISNGNIDFKFKHISAFLCLTLSPDMLASASSNVIGSISVSTTSSTPLSVGEGDTFDFSTLTANTTNGSNTVQINAINHTLTEDWTVYIPILPQPADATLTITVTGNDGSTLYNLSKAAPATGFLAGNAYQLNLNNSTTPEVNSKQLIGAYFTYNYVRGERWNEDCTISYNADGKIDSINCLVIDSIYGNEEQLITFEYSEDGKSLKATLFEDATEEYTIAATLNEMGHFEKAVYEYADDTSCTHSFTYNEKGSLIRMEESDFDATSTFEYDSNNDAIQRSYWNNSYAVDTITSNIIYSDLENKTNMQFIRRMDDYDNYYFVDYWGLIGFYGIPSTHLPIQQIDTSAIDVTTNSANFEWTTDEEGYPTKLIVTMDYGSLVALFTWSSDSR